MRTPSLVLTTLLLVPTPTQSQPAPVTRPAPPLRPQPVGPGGEVIIYRDRNFNGPAVAISHDEPNLRLVWTVNSAKVRGGTWHLCERPNFHAPCLTLSSNNSNLGHRRVQSAQMMRSGSWRTLGDADVSRLGWDHRVIHVRGNPTLSDLRFCAERNRIRLHDARARFSNGRFQTLRPPLTVNSGSCTGSLSLNNQRAGLMSVDVTVSTVTVAARGRVRLEGR